MKLPTANIQNTKIGSCPHGLPPGACPICSGAGGGGASLKKADFSAKPGEMSWAECAAIGNMLKAQKMAHKQNEQAFQAQITAAANFEKTLSNLALKMADFSNNIQKSLPSVISKPIAFVLNSLMVPVLNIIKNLPLNIQNVFAKISEKLTDISDKLNAVFGELKNSIEKKISDKLKDFKKKATTFMSVFGLAQVEDEEEKIEEEKRIFELKNALNSIQENLINDKGEKYGES